MRSATRSGKKELNVTQVSRKKSIVSSMKKSKKGSEQKRPESVGRNVRINLNESRGSTMKEYNHVQFMP